MRQSRRATTGGHLIAAALMLAACSSKEEPCPARADLGAPSCPDAHVADGPPRTDVFVAPEEGDTRLVLKDGSEHAGELVAIYDHSIWWWTPDDLQTYALFRGDAFRAYPDDRSLSFFSSDNIDLVITSSPRPKATRYRQFMRDQGFVLSRSPLDGVSYVIMGNESYHREEDGFGDFAWDFVRADGNGLTYDGLGVANEDHYVWGEPVYLPRGGYVVDVIRDAPDNAPGSYPEGAVNNVVGVHLGGSYYLYMIHFQQGSIPSQLDQSCEPHVPGVTCVQEGTFLPTGAFLGRVGNSGVSLVPHLHMTLYFYDEEATSPRSWSVPVELADLYVAESPLGPAEKSDYVSPKTGHYVSSEAF